MHITLDRQGRAIVAGEGTYRTPMGADESDVMMNSPGLVAQMLQERENSQTLAANREMDRRDAQRQAQEDQQAREEMLALDYENYQAEAMAAEYGGENPMLYIAAMQTLAGDSRDFEMPMSGNGLSNDGRRSSSLLSGRLPLGRGLGDWFSDISQTLTQATQSAQEVVSSVSPLVESVQDLIAPDVQAAPAPGPSASPRAVAAKASAAISSSFQKFMKAKVGPIPAPLLLAGAVVAAVVIAKKRK